MATAAAEPVGDEIYDFTADCEELFSQVQVQLKGSVSGIINLFEEYRHWFIVWTVYLGVFADKLICLDRRLRRHPDV